MNAKVFEPDVVMKSFRKLMVGLDETCSRDPQVAQNFLELVRTFATIREKEFSRSQRFELKTIQSELEQKLVFIASKKTGESEAL